MLVGEICILLTVSYGIGTIILVYKKNPKNKKNRLKELNSMPGIMVCKWQKWIKNWAWLTPDLDFSNSTNSREHWCLNLKKAEKMKEEGS